MFLSVSRWTTILAIVRCGVILLVVRIKAAFRSRKTVLQMGMGVLFWLLLTGVSISQTETDKPVPILTGNIGTFSFVTGGHNVIDTQVNPVLLVPVGDKWLIESRAEFEGEFQRPPGGGPYGGPVDKHVDYAQLDYIANRFVTVTSGFIPSGFVFCSRTH